MSTEGIKALACRLIDEVWNRGDLGVADETVAADFLWHNVGVQGVQAFKRHVDAIRAVFPDLHVAVEDQIAEGDKVVTRWTTTGTHKGEWMGHPPTDKPMRQAGITILRFAGGRAVEAWQNEDLLGAFQQLGFLPLLMNRGE